MTRKFFSLLMTMLLSASVLVLGEAVVSSSRLVSSVDWAAACADDYDDDWEDDEDEWDEDEDDEDEWDEDERGDDDDDDDDDDRRSRRRR